MGEIILQTEADRMGKYIVIYDGLIKQHVSCFYNLP